MHSPFIAGAVKQEKTDARNDFNNLWLCHGGLVFFVVPIKQQPPA